MRYKILLVFFFVLGIAVGYYLNAPTNEPEKVKMQLNKTYLANSTFLAIEWVSPKQGDVVGRKHLINVAVYPPCQCEIKARLSLKPKATIAERAPGWVPGKALVFRWDVIAEPGEYTATVELIASSYADSLTYTWNYVVRD